VIAAVHRAPWCVGLVIATALSSAILLAVTWMLIRVVPAGIPWPAFRTLLQALPLAILLISVLFVVRGYELTYDALHVRRLLWSTVVPLADITRAWADPKALRAVRLFGNGGLFSISGLFWNRSLGRFRVFANDPRRAVVLDLAGRRVVVTPERPDAFLDDLRRFYPQLARTT